MLLKLPNSKFCSILLNLGSSQQAPALNPACFDCFGILTAMAPKRAAAKPAAKPAAGKPPARKAPVGPAVKEDRNLQANMLTQPKKSTDPDKQEALALYQSSPRASPEETALLQKWKSDRSCKWAASYKQEVASATIKRTSSLDGYGTKRLACLNFRTLELPLGSRSILLRVMLSLLALRWSIHVFACAHVCQVRCGQGLEHARGESHFAVHLG